MTDPIRPSNHEHPRESYNATESRKVSHGSQPPSKTHLPGRTRPPFKESPEEARRQRLLVAKALILPTEFVVIPMLGLYLGRHLDHHWGTGPWLTVVGGLLGLGAAIRSLFEAFKASSPPPKVPPQK